MDTKYKLKVGLCKSINKHIQYPVNKIIKKRRIKMELVSDGGPVTMLMQANCILFLSSLAMTLQCSYT
jgi:hypothetical protein